MRLDMLRLLLGLGLASTGSAAPNAFTAPLGDFSIHAGQTMEVSWEEVSGDTVSLQLLQGSPEDLRPVVPVATNIANAGSTYWKVPDSVAPGRYSMEITANNGAKNYSPFFAITDAVSPARRPIQKPKASKKSRWLW